MDDDSEHKKTRGTKKCVIKRKLMRRLNRIILKSQQRFKSDYRNLCTEKINKIALSSNGDKRLQTFDIIATHPYRINAFKVCQNVMLSKI